MSVKISKCSIQYKSQLKIEYFLWSVHGASGKFESSVGQTGHNDYVQNETKSTIFIRNILPCDLQYAKKGTFGQLRNVSFQISLRSPSRVT